MSFFSIVFAALATLPLARAVDLAVCNNDIQARLANRSLAFDDPIFFFDGTKHMSQPNNIQLTIDGCRATCPRPDHDLYGDMWPRLLTWLVPALLLIGNLHLPRVGTLNRLLVVVHFVGDPIDSMWALLTKAEVWNRFYRLASRHTPPMNTPKEREHAVRRLAVTLSAFEELTGDMASVREDLDVLLASGSAALSRDDMDYVMAEAAEELVDSRSNEVLRTLLVVANYLYHVVAALVPQIGGEQTSKPGGRIGTAMFLSYLVTMVLLSNTMSGFTTRRTCLRIMERYTRTVQGRSRDTHYFPNSPHLHRKSRWLSNSASGKGRATVTDFIDAQPWNGAVYSFRPNKRLTPSGASGDRSPFYLLLLSIAPVLVAAACGFVIIWFTPAVGLGCRTLWVIVITIAMLLSPILTWAIHRFVGGRFGWYLTILKDLALGGPSIAVIGLSSIGIFNTCWCWSAVYSRGYANAFITLDPGDERATNMKVLYPAMCGLCLGLELVVYYLMHKAMKAGGQIFRPKEDEKMDEYRRIHGLSASPSAEMGVFSEARALLARNGSDDRGNDHLTLPPPAISPHASPHPSPSLGPQVYPQPIPGDSLGNPPAYGYGQAYQGHHGRPSQGSEFSYGGSPELRGPDQPLLGSPIFNRGR